MNKLFSIKEAANILGVSGKTLRRWEEKGILVPHRTPGNQRRYTRDQIDNFRQKKTDLPKTSSQPSSSLLSIQEVANILGVHGKTLRRWEEKGILVPLRTRGNQRRYMRDQINNFRQKKGDLSQASISRVPEVTPSQLLSYPQEVEISKTSPDQIQKSEQYWVEESIKSISVFKKLAVFGVSIMLFVAVFGVAAATLKSANLLNIASLPKILSILGISKNKLQTPELSEVLRGKAVLGAGTAANNLVFGVNVQSEFADSAQFLNTIKVAGVATLSGGVITEDQDVNAGTGELTASNVLYGAVAGDGVTVGTGQTPTITNTGVLSLTAGSGISVGTGSKPAISNTGVLSLGGSTGTLTLTAGTGITISGLTITNSALTFKTIAVGSSSIVAASLTDTLTFEAGSGIILATNTTSKTVTIAGGGAAGWQENSGALSPSNITNDLLLGGISTSTAKFAFINNAGGTPTASVAGNLTLDSAGVIQTTKNQTLTIGGGTTGNIILSPNNGGAGSLLTVNSLLLTLSGTTTLTGTSLTSIAGGATAIDFTEFDISASTGSITINDGGDAGNISIEGTVLDINSLDFTAGGAITTGGTGDLTLDAGGSNILLSDALNAGGAGAQAYNFFASDTSGVSTPDGVADLYIQDELEVDGTVRFNNLTYTFPGTETTNYLLQTNGSGTLSWIDPAVSGGYFTTSNGVGYPRGPYTAVNDLLIGSTASTSAKFAFINVNSGTPTASVAGNLTLDSAGVIQTTKNQTLAIGGTTTGDISFTPKNVQSLYLSGLTGRIGAGTVTNPVGMFNISGDAGNNATLILNNTGVSTSDIFTASSSGTTRFVVTNRGGIGINTGANNSTLLSTLDVRPNLTNGGTLSIASASGATSFAGLLVDNTGVGDLFTASKSGAIKFVILNNGNLQFAGQTNFLTTLASAATAARTITFPDKTGTICVSGDTCATSGTVGYWNQSTLGTLFPGNSTVDLLVGGTTSASAKFAFLNVNSGTPTASISAASGNNATTLTGLGVLGTTNMQTLTLGNASTGNIVVDSSSSSITLSDNTNLANNLLLNIGTANTDFSSSGGLVLDDTLNISGSVTTGISMQAVVDGSITTGVTIGGTLAGLNITTGYSYELLAISLGGVHNAIGTDAYLVKVSESLGATATLTNGFHLSADGSGATVANGLLIDAANSAVITDAIDISSTGMTNGINLGANNIKGTTATIDFTNFDVAAGNSTTTTLTVANSSTGDILALNATGTGTTANGLIISQTSSGTITDAIDVSDETITNALRLGTNTILGTTATIDFTDFDVASTGLLTIAPDAALTTAIDVSDADIVNAIDVGVHVILGTTATIDFTNFDVAAGNSTTTTLTVANSSTGDILALNATGTGTTANGLIISQTSSGTITDAIDVSDETITNALSLGTNTILGSGSFTIDLLNTGGAQTLSIDNSSTASNTTVAHLKLVDGHLGIEADPNTWWGIYDAASISEDCSTLQLFCIGVNSSLAVDGAIQTAGADNSAVALNASIVFNPSGTITLTNTYGLRVTNPTVGAGPDVITNNYGIFVANQTIGNTIDYGVYIEGADTNAIFVDAGASRFDGLVSVGLSGTASTTAVCSSLAGATTPTAGTAYELRDCSGTPVADYMEMYSVEQDIEHGDLVMPGSDYITMTDGDRLSKLTKTKSAYEPRIIGVVSDLSQAGDFNSIGHNIRKEDNPMPIALSGRVQVKVSLENGPIQPGDPITSSSIPGVAMRATRAGQIIGKALESYNNPDPTAVGKIIVFVNLSWYDPTVYLTSSGDLSYSMSTQSAAMALGLAAQPQVPTINSSQLTINSASNAASFDLASDQNFIDLKNRVGSLEAKVAFDATQIEDLRNTIVNSSTESAFLSSIASEPAVLGTSTSADFISNLQNLDIASATISADLMVLGRTTTAELGVTGNISAGLLSIHGLDTSLNNRSGGASINSVGDLNLQNNGLGGINILSGKVTIDTEGNIKTQGEIIVKKVNVDTADQDARSLGSGVIGAGETSVDISTTAVTNKSRIFVTATTKTGGQALIVTHKTASDGSTPIKSGFTVGVEQPYDRDIKFDWFIVDEK